VRKLRQICSTAFAVVLFSMCFGLLAIRILGMGTFIVTGSSMEPTINKGALVIVEPVAPSLIERGDIITFEHYGQTTTHRVIALDRANPLIPVFTTKGDANAAADPEPVHFPGQVGIYRASIPLVGYAIVYAQAYWRLALMVFAALAFLGCAAILVFSNVKAARPRSRRQTAQVIPIEHEELWASHIGWLREAAVRRVA
jgi:signal peptidase